MTRRILMTALVLGFAGYAGSALADAIAMPRADSEVRGMVVRLSDVFDGVPASIDRDIAQAPTPCKRVVYDVNVLTRLAQKYRLDWTAQSMADHVTVTTACTRITTDAIKEAIIQHMKDDGVRGEIDVTLDNRALEIALPADQSTYFSLNNFSYDTTARRFRSEIVPTGTLGAASIPVAGRVTVRQSLPVLAHRLEAGTTITANDIDWIPVQEENITASVVQNPAQLIGREVRRDTNGGELLRSSDIRPVRNVVRGTIVTLRIETPYMQLSAQGKAMQDGADGEIVRVMNAQSNRLVEGIVDGPGVVRVPLASEPAQKLAQNIVPNIAPHTATAQ